MAVETPPAPAEEQDKQDQTPEQDENEPKQETPQKESRPPRRRPGRPGRGPGRPPKDGKKAKKKPALYHLYERDEEGVLSPLADQEAKTAEGAVTVFLKTPPTDLTEFVEQVKNGEAVVVAIPERNYTVVGAEEEVKTRLRIKARK